MAATDIDKLFCYLRADDVGLLELSSPTTQIGANSTGSATGISIGFEFRLDGVSYTTIAVFAYGFARLAGTESSANNSNLFASNTNVIIAPWWDDMKTAESTGYVKTETQGSAPWRRFIIEWRCYSYSGNTAANNDLLNFQAVLYETTDRIEFRYAPSVQTGSPTLMDASVGIKGDTTLTDNWREIYSDTLALGGDNTAAYDGMEVASNYDVFAASGARVFEPNWPMCGRGLLIDPNELTGFDPYSMVMWKIANFSNWLYCRHTPALLNLSPYMPSAAASIELIAPCDPSADERAYEVLVQVYASTGTNCTVDVFKDAAADPQPSVGGDWTSIASDVQAVTGSAWNALTAIDCVIAPNTQYLRITVTMTAGTCRVGSIIVRPTPLDDIDETAAPATGWRPMGLAQVRQPGGAIHPEWFNRAWKNLAYVLGDLRQQVWSFCLDVGEDVVGSTAKAAYPIGVSKATLAGFRRQAAKARIYARDTSGGAPLTLAEEGHARLAEFTVATGGGEFRRQEADIELLSDVPAITAAVQPTGSMYPAAILIDWAPDLSTGSLIQGVTPAPKLAYLDAIAARMELALRCYAHAGIATMLERGKGTATSMRVQTIVGPATKALRPIIARCSGDHDEQSAASELFGQSSGSGAADEIIIPSPHTQGSDEYPPVGAIAYAASAQVYEEIPGAAMDRLLESPTATSLDGAAREYIEVALGVGITFAASPADALDIAG